VLLCYDMFIYIGGRGRAGAGRREKTENLTSYYDLGMHLHNTWYVTHLV